LNLNDINDPEYQLGNTGRYAFSLSTDEQGRRSNRLEERQRLVDLGPTGNMNMYVTNELYDFERTMERQAMNLPKKRRKRRRRRRKTTTGTKRRRKRKGKKNASKHRRLIEDDEEFNVNEESKNYDSEYESEDGSSENSKETPFRKSKRDASVKYCEMS
jgi:hypothetical protein